MLRTTRTWAAVVTLTAALAGASVEADAQATSPSAGRDAGRVDLTATPPSRLELLGVVIRGDLRRALVREPVLTEGRARWVEVGAPLGDYTVIAIERDRVVLDDDGDALAVRLAGPRASRRAVSPAAARPTAGGDTRASPATSATGTVLRRPVSIADFLAWRIGARVEDIQARIRDRRSWLAVAQEYGLDPAETVREYRAWRAGR